MRVVQVAKYLEMTTKQIFECSANETDEIVFVDNDYQQFLLHGIEPPYVLEWCNKIL